MHPKYPDAVFAQLKVLARGGDIGRRPDTVRSSMFRQFEKLVEYRTEWRDGAVHPDMRRDWLDKIRLLVENARGYREWEPSRLP